MKWTVIALVVCIAAFPAFAWAGKAFLDAADRTSFTSWGAVMELCLLMMGVGSVMVGFAAMFGIPILLVSVVFG